MTTILLRASWVALVVKNPPANVEDILIPGLGRSGGGHGTTPLFLPVEPHGQSSLAGYSPYGHEESDMTSD